MKDNDAADYSIRLIETNRRTYRMNAYAFALALSGAFTAATVSTGDVENPFVLYIQFSAAMLIVGHLIFQKKLNPMFDQAIAAVREKQKADQDAVGNG